MPSDTPPRARRAFPYRAAAVGVAVAVALCAAGTAGAASVAYIEDGNVWLSSPDGTSKVQLTTDGTLDRPWYTPSQSPDGRTFAVQRLDWINYLDMRLQTFSASDGKPGARVTLLLDGDGKLIQGRPLSGDVNDEGSWFMNEATYTTSGFWTYTHVGWLTPTQQEFGLTKPLGPAGARQPTFWGNRVVWSDGTNIQLGEYANGGITGIYGNNPQSWIGPGSFKALKRADVPPGGGKVAVEAIQNDDSNVISIIPFTGTGPQPPLDPGNGCDMPRVGNAHSVSWSPDGTMIAWRDDRGLVVSGAPILPSPVDNICKLASPPVVITSRPASSTREYKEVNTYLTLGGPSFGGADVAAIIAARNPPPPSAPARQPTAPATPTVSRGPVTAPATAPLTAPIVIDVNAPRAGTLTAVGRIPARLARQLRVPVVVARGNVRVRKKGKVALRLVPTAAGRRAAARLKGKTMTVTVTIPGRGPVTIPIRIG